MHTHTYTITTAGHQQSQLLLIVDLSSDTCKYMYSGQQYTQPEYTGGWKVNDNYGDTHKEKEKETVL